MSSLLYIVHLAVYIHGTSNYITLTDAVSNYVTLTDAVSNYITHSDAVSNYISLCIWSMLHQLRDVFFNVSVNVCVCVSWFVYMCLCMLMYACLCVRRTQQRNI